VGNIYFTDSQNCKLNFENILNNVVYAAIQLKNCIEFNVNITGTISSSSYTNILLDQSNNNKIYLTGASAVSGSSTGGINSVNSSSGNVVYNGTFSGSGGTHFICKDTAHITSINPTFGTGTVYSTPGNGFASVTFNNYGTVTTDHRTYFNTVTGSILSDTVTRHTPSGISWKMITGNAPSASNPGPSSTFPLTLPIAKIACNSSALVTASVWVYRSSTSLTTKLVCPGGQILGVTSDVSVSAVGAINTWEQLTITFTPTQQGVVELQVQCYGAAANVYVDDFSVSQA
jgi:hypothetical protein